MNEALFPERNRDIQPTLDEVIFRHVLQNMQSLNSHPAARRTVPQGQFFNYGEMGYGILMPNRLAFVSSENGEDIKLIIGDVEIVDGWLRKKGSKEFPPCRNLSGKIPQQSITGIVDFARRVRNYSEDF